jgi:hypothetical protein
MHAFHTVRAPLPPPIESKKSLRMMLRFDVYMYTWCWLHSRWTDGMASGALASSTRGWLHRGRLMGALLGFWASFRSFHPPSIYTITCIIIPDPGSPCSNVPPHPLLLFGRKLAQIARLIMDPTTTTSFETRPPRTTTTAHPTGRTMPPPSPPQRGEGADGRAREARGAAAVDSDWASQLWMENGHWALLAEHHPDRLVVGAACPFVFVCVWLHARMHLSLVPASLLHQLTAACLPTTYIHTPTGHHLHLQVPLVEAPEPATAAARVGRGASQRRRRRRGGGGGRGR